MTDGDTTQPATDPKGDEGSKETPAEKETSTNEDTTSDSLLSKASAFAERIEAANKKTEELLGRQERLAAEQLLGGKAEAGQPSEKPKEPTDTEYAESLERGEVNPLKEDGLI